MTPQTEEIQIQAKSCALKKIELFGFKSFAERAVVVFSDGLNGIVGPNGCGKSNVTDAFKWVLGEQSTKSLRAPKMQDVIFHGTTKRKSLGLAEVTITFSNESKFLPIDYAEVAVTRRLHRDGESLYFINKHQVRLKDVHDLFMHSGVGKDAFAIIEQGKVDTLVKESPQERRRIFEEAAGIQRFLERRKESMKKLEKAEEALLRVQDLYSEVERQLTHLEKQVEEAKRYKNEKDELTQLEYVLIAKRFDDRERKKVRLTEKMVLFQKELESLEELEKEQREKLSQEKEKIATTRSSHFAIAEKLHEIKTKKEVVEHDIRQTEDALAKISDKITSFSQEEKRLQDEEKRLIPASESAEKELQQKRLQLAGIEEERKQALKEVLHLQKEVEEFELVFRATLSQTHAIESELQKLQSELNAKTLKQEALKDRLQERQKRLDISSSKLQEEEINLVSFTSKKETLTDDVQKIKAEYELVKTANHDLQKSIQAVKIREDKEKETLFQLEARFSALSRMKDEMQGFSHGAKTILKEAKRAASPIFQRLLPLAEMITIGEEKSEWIEVFGRLYNSTLVVEKEEDLVAVLQFAKDNKVQELSLLCLEFLQRGRSLADHLFESLVSVSSFDEVKSFVHANQGKPLLMQGGLFIDTRGVIFFGVQKDSAKDGNLVLQEKELKKLQKQVAEQKQKLLDAQQERKVLEQQGAELQKSNIDKEQKLKQLERELFEIGFSCDRIQKSLKEKIEEQKRVEEEVRQLKMQGQELLSFGANEETSLSEKKEMQSQSRKQLTAHEANLLKKRAEYREKEATLRSFEKAVQEQMGQLTRLEVAKESYSMKLQELLRTIEKLKSDFELNSHQKKTLEDRRVALLQKQEESIAIFQQTKEKLVQEELVEKDCQELFSKMEAVCADVGKSKQEKALKVAELSATLSNIEEQIVSLERELVERFSLTKEELFTKDLQATVPDNEVDKRCAFLRARMNEYSHVNLRALEDYEECKTRKDFLNCQLADLDGSKKELVACIQDLEKESREQFVKTFEAIRAGFSRNFSTLFEGGQADLICTETEDPLTCGIDLVAKPPGKELKSVQLLSGGEKCLTALALLFAIFDCRPAPFCILDEVDAPLDELNVDRFNKMIKSYCDRCQFLIITHNKRTMLHADRLIGVSMQEKGISEVLQLELHHRDSESRAKSPYSS